MPEPTSVRLPEKTKAQLEALAKHLNIKSKAALIAMAVAKLAHDELPRQKGKK